MPLSSDTKSKIIKMIQDEMAEELREQRSRAERMQSLQGKENLGFYLKIPYIKNPYIKIPYLKLW